MIARQHRMPSKVSWLFVLMASLAGLWEAMSVASAAVTPTVEGVSVSSLGATSVSVTVTLTNPDAQSAEVHLRYRTPPDAGSWDTSIAAETTTGTSVTFTLSSLTSGTEYRAEVSIGDSFASPTAEDFTADSSTVGSISLGTPTRTSLEITINIDSPDGANRLFYVRWRTPAATGTFGTAQTIASSGATATYTITGLDDGTDYRVEVDEISTFDSPQSEDFTTETNIAPSFGASVASREIYENAAEEAIVGDPVTALDSDGDDITYSLSGTDFASFTIGSTTGQITLGAGVTLDFETTRQYAMIVTATDTFSDSDSIAVTIDVLDVQEDGVLGTVIITIGSTGDTRGYRSGAFGQLNGGSFPGALFKNATARTVSEITENADGEWTFVYTGTPTLDWQDDQDLLDEITLNVRYQGGVDSRSFVLGGFIESETGNYTLELHPPIPDRRDWADRVGQRVEFEFVPNRHQAVETNPPPTLTDPTTERGSFLEFLADTTPGGPVTAQTLITILVYAGFILRAPSTPGAIMLGALVLVMTPWIPVVMGFGSTMAASSVAMNVVNGAFVYKVFAARTES